MEWLSKCAELEMAVGSQNWMHGEMIVACEGRVSFFKDTISKDDMRIELFHDLEKEAEEGAREKVFVQMLFRDVSG
ncbi:hypothetical protein Tco_1486844 [Tanacetum coccineum]